MEFNSRLDEKPISCGKNQGQQSVTLQYQEEYLQAYEYDLGKPLLHVFQPFSNRKVVVISSLYHFSMCHKYLFGDI